MAECVRSSRAPARPWLGSGCLQALFPAMAPGTRAKLCPDCAKKMDELLARCNAQPEEATTAVTENFRKVIRDSALFTNHERRQKNWEVKLDPSQMVGWKSGWRSYTRRFAWRTRRRSEARRISLAIVHSWFSSRLICRSHRMCPCALARHQVSFGGDAQIRVFDWRSYFAAAARSSTIFKNGAPISRGAVFVKSFPEMFYRAKGR
jgi:hypothetical protein